MLRLIALILLLISMLLRALGLMLLESNEMPLTTPNPTAIVEAVQTPEPAVMVLPTTAPARESSSGKKSSGRSSSSEKDDDDSYSSDSSSSWMPSRDEDTLPEVDVSDDHGSYEGGDSFRDEDTLPEIDVD